SNLLYRRASSLQGNKQSNAFRTRDAPDWKSAIQQIGNLRYISDTPHCSTGSTRRRHSRLCHWPCPECRANCPSNNFLVAPTLPIRHVLSQFFPHASEFMKNDLPKSF